MSKTKSGDATRIGALLSWLQPREDEMAALLADLVAIPTENPPGKNYRACADLLENRLRQVGLEWKLASRKKAPATTPSVWLQAMDEENAFSTFTDITTLFRRSRGSNSTLCA